MFIIKIKKIISPDPMATAMAAAATCEIERTIFEQRVENLDIEAVIAVINKLEKPKAN